MVSISIRQVASIARLDQSGRYTCNSLCHLIKKHLISGPNINISSSLNNFEQQLASLDCTDDVKLTAPHNNFELSAFTNTRTKLFDDLAIPSGEVTDRIDINFSAVQQIGGDDDLDEIQKDLKQNFGNAPFQRQNISEYIEVDLNMTNVMKNDDDISITDTVNNLVHDMSKSTSTKNIDKDWLVDKENVAINPYAAPRETENFAINEELDKVLVFDGKRLTIQSEKSDKENYRKTLLPNASNNAPQRKNIVLNVNDDLPNFIDDPISNNSGFIGVADLKKSLIIDDMSITEPLQHVKQLSTINDLLCNMSETQVVPSVMPVGNRTILYEDDGNISVTKVVPTKIIAEKRMTIFDDSNISITQSLPTNLQEATQREKRQTIVFDDGDISMTQALPVNIIPNKTKRRTIVYEDNTGNLSITQAVPNILIKEAKAEKRRTIVYEDDTGNISVTQAIPSNIILAENSCDRRRTVVFESDTGNISVTQAVPSSLILQEQMDINSQANINTQVQIENTRRRTIVYENDTGNLSITQAVPNQIIQGISTQNLISHDAKPIPTDEATNRRRTIVFDNDDADISVTQAVSLNQVICALKNDQEENRLRDDAKENLIRKSIMTDVKEKELKRDIVASKADKRRTVVFDNEDADISVTQAVNLNQIIPGFVQNVHNDLEAALNDALHNKDSGKSQRKIVYDEDNTNVSQNGKERANISVSLSLKDNVAEDVVMPMNVIRNLNQFSELNIQSKTELKRRTVVFENDEADLSMTQTVSSNHIVPKIVENDDDLEAALNEALHNKNSGKSQRTITYDDNDSIKSENYKENISGSLDLQDNVKDNAVKRRTVVFENDNISMMQAHDINSECSHSEEPNTAGSLEESVIDMEVAEKSNTKQFDHVLRKSINSERSSVNILTKPIPSNLSTVIGENLKPATKYSDLESSSKSVSNVMVYQAALSKRTEQGDSKSQEPIAIENDEKLSSSSKITDDVKQTDEKLSLAKTTDAIKVENSSESTNHESQAEKQMTENQETPENQNEMAEQTNQSEINDDLSQMSDTTSQMSKSILNDLLDMSSTNGVEDTGVTAELETKETDSNHLTTVPKSCTGTNSNDTLFYITKDVEDDAQVQTDKCDSTELPQLTEHSPLPLDYRQDEPQIVVDVKNKIGILKNAVSEEASLKNRHYEKILSSDLDKTKKDIVPRESKSFKTANDTNELLEMLSDLTDRTMPRNLDTHLEEDEEKPEPILIKGHLALENKSELYPEPRRLSFATTRQSIIMSREDLLNNISLAGAALKSRCFEDSDLNTTEESPEEASPKKSVRHSSEVVKTLHFDETDTSIHDIKNTPLKKTAFGETSYMQEHKAKVIPDYLKDVSDGIKELMDDLVKPNADVLPFDAVGIDKGVRKVPSTCSTHIQANLVTSSQIDMNTGLYSNPDSIYDVNVNKISSVDMINDAVNRSVSRALKSPIKSSTATRASEKSFDSKMDVSITDVQTIIPSRPPTQSPGRVLIFDHNNPLNNILLAPETFTDVHRYNPGQSTDTICISERSHSVQMSINEKDNYEIERVSTQYNVGNFVHSVKQSGDASSGKIAESQSKTSNLSKPMSIDQSTDAKMSDMKSTEVNTVIAMKGNKELLDASSSLTLVDDALARSTFDVEIDSRTTTSQEEMSKSPVRVIYTVNRDEMIQKLDSDFTSNDDLDDRKAKKRMYSPTKRDKHKNCTITNLDITPKPNTKMLKLSNSPNGFKPVEVLPSAEKEDKEQVDKKKKSPRKAKSKLPGTSITVQQLMTEYKVGPIDHEALDEQIKYLLRDPKSDSSSIEPIATASQSDVQECKSLDMVSSCTSSNNLREDRSEVISSQSSKVSRMDWQPDIMDNLSSKNLLSECDSSVNVVAKIDMLPFMG